MTAGPESEPDRARRHYQWTLFDGIADRYEAEAFRPGATRQTSVTMAQRPSRAGP